MFSRAQVEGWKCVIRRCFGGFICLQRANLGPLFFAVGGLALLTIRWRQTKWSRCFCVCGGLGAPRILLSANWPVAFLPWGARGSSQFAGYGIPGKMLNQSGVPHNLFAAGDKLDRCVFFSWWGCSAPLTNLLAAGREVGSLLFVVGGLALLTILC